MKQPTGVILCPQAENDGPQQQHLPAPPKIGAYLRVGFLLSMLILAFFGPTALRGQALCEGEGVSFYLPMREAVANAWQHGHWPLWNPYTYGGMPLLADCQAGALYPPNLLYLWLSPVTALNAVALLGELLAGWGMIALLRDHRVSPGGAATGALCFVFSEFLVAHLGHVTIVNAVVWLPWICLAVHRWCRFGQRRWLIAGTLLWAVQLMAGHPQMVLYSALIAGALIISELAKGKRQVWKRIPGLGLMAAVAMLLCAVQILPTLALSSETGRSFTPSMDIFCKYRLTLVNTPLLWLPHLFGTQSDTPLKWSWWGDWNFVEQAGYTGLLPWMLLPAAIFLPGGRWRGGRTWAIIAGLSVLLAWNIETPLGRLLFHVPVYNAFESAGRHLIGLALGLSMVAGIGLDALREATPTDAQTWSRRGAWTILTLVGMIACAAVWGYEYAIVHVDYGLNATPARVPWSQHAWLRMPWMLLVPLLMALLSAKALLRYTERPVRSTGAVLIVVFFLDLGSVSYLCAWRWRPAAHENQPPVPELATLLRKSVNEGDCPPRYILLGPWGLEDALNPQGNMRYHLASLNGYGPFQLRRFSAMVGSMKHDGRVDDTNLIQHSRALDLWSCRYVVAQAPGDQAALGLMATAPAYRLVRSPGTLRVYENTGAMPRARIVHHVLPLPGQDAVLRAITDGVLPDGRRLEPESSTLVESEVDLHKLETSEAAVATTGETWVNWRDYQQDRLRLDARTPDRGVLVLSEPFMDGWEATVDGRPVPVVRVDYMLRGISLPAGTHAVEMRYRPAALRHGQSGSAFGVAALLVVGLWPGKRKLAGAARAQHPSPKPE